MAHFTIFLLLALLANFAIAFPAAKNCEHPGNSSAYASPQLYLFGGQGEDNEYLSTASHFNSSTGEWEATTETAIARHVSCGVALGTNIYLFGGYNRSGLKTSEVYDCETGTYSQFRSMPSARDECGAAVLSDYIYIAGGRSGSEYLSSVIRYNIHSTRRENVASMINKRSAIQMVEVSGRLYVIGGGSRAVEAYNATTNRWNAVSSTKYAHNYFGAAVHEGQIYVCSELGFEVYSPDTDEWRELPALGRSRARTLISMNGKLWALGGGNYGSKSVYTFNTATNRWSREPEMDAARRYHLSFVVNH